MSEGHAIRLPLTQTDLADALGLTPISVNRILQAIPARAADHVAAAAAHSVGCSRGCRTFPGLPGVSPARLYAI